MMNKRPQTMQAHDLLLSGLNVHFWKGGAGPAILLLHAAWGDAELSWNRVWEGLARSYTVIAPDLPGFGRSESLSQPSLPGMSAVLKELLEALRQDTVMVAGNSLGAGVAIQFANDHPKAVSQLVLVNGGYLPSIPAFMRALISLPGVNKGFRALIRHFSFSSQALKRSFVDPAGLPPGFLEKIRHSTMAYSRISFDTIMNLTEPLEKPAVPALLLWGAQDGLATLKQAQALQKWLAGAKCIMINGAGHMPQVEKPEEFLKAITERA